MDLVVGNAHAACIQLAGPPTSGQTRMSTCAVEWGPRASVPLDESARQCINLLRRIIEVDTSVSSPGAMASTLRSYGGGSLRMRNAQEHKCEHFRDASNRERSLYTRGVTLPVGNAPRVYNDPNIVCIFLTEGVLSLSN